MEVILPEKPKEDLYLKSFVGDVYESGAWRSVTGRLYRKLGRRVREAQEGADARKYF